MHFGQRDRRTDRQGETYIPPKLRLRMVLQKTKQKTKKRTNKYLNMLGY